MSAHFPVDADVLSAGAPSKARPIPELVDWMDRNSRNLYVSVGTIAVIAKHHDLTILTRNLEHYAPFGMAAHDPAARLPPE